MRPFDSLTLMQFCWAFLAILGFSIRVNLKGIKILFTSLAGGLSWAFYLIILYYSSSVLFSVFISIILVCIYSEILAPRLRTPVSVFVTCAIIPLVPGRGLFQSMQYYIAGNNVQASKSILETMLIAGTISISIALVSSVTNLVNKLINRF
ncbi:MAG TPA: threonine/serine exporter family protein [Candidatus Cloacimonas sp.]|nr:threonine/serine exporter family protein [Candidatus Cloacimonas sp.]